MHMQTHGFTKEGATTLDSKGASANRESERERERDVTASRQQGAETHCDRTKMKTTMLNDRVCASHALHTSDIQSDPARSRKVPESCPNKLWTELRSDASFAREPKTTLSTWSLEGASSQLFRQRSNVIGCRRLRATERKNLASLTEKTYSHLVARNRLWNTAYHLGLSSSTLQPGHPCPPWSLDHSRSGANLVNHDSFKPRP